eukprot:TRINITY_DN11702_c0_g2_i1.p1 TRINITY_DN11702_c0_g2~~TRINITY_DN11702_c0_g2_i1.p1  ORF type:complete len:313 (+),score=58.83 TRINITY_DN11702_c0_g2_i1:73-1011(+)
MFANGVRHVLMRNISLNRTFSQAMVVPKRRLWPKIVLPSAVILGSVGIYNHEALIRFSNAAWAIAKISARYKYAFWGIERTDPEYYEQHQVHLEAAKDLLKVCKKNRGIYVKLAQYVASLNHVLPPEVTNTLSVLQDKAPHMPYDQVEIALQNEFGKKIEDIFVSFDKEPIAAASLAQVHRATLADGRECAVKVQYLGLRDRVMIDLYGIRILSWFIMLAFPAFEFKWAIPDMERDVLSELDFQNEGKNSERIARNFGENPRLKIPKVYWDFTTKNIMCMEWCEGTKVTDVVQLTKLNFNLKEVGRLSLIHI